MVQRGELIYEIVPGDSEAKDACSIELARKVEVKEARSKVAASRPAYSGETRRATGFGRRRRMSRIDQGNGDGEDTVKQTPSAVFKSFEDMI